MNEALRFEAFKFRLGPHLQDASKEIEVNGAVDAGTIRVLMGPSGCGKTTFLRSVVGLHPVVSGKLYIGERDISVEKVSTRALGYLSQKFSLFRHMSVEGNLRFALEHSAEFCEYSPELMRERIADTLSQLGLDGFMSRDCSSLSGGEAARVSFARTVIARPRALLLDEAFSALDVDNRDRLHQILLKYLEQNSIPVLLVSHHEVDSLQLGKKVILWPVHSPLKIQF